MTALVRVTANLALGLLVVATACGAPPNSDTQVIAQPAHPPFVGRTWLSTDPSAPLGTLRIFLPDGTLVMDSCGETYRLAQWRAIGEGRIEWQEDTERIEAEVAQSAPDQLRLRLRLRSEIKEESYRLAHVPFVCPDSRPVP